MQKTQTSTGLLVFLFCVLSFAISISIFNSSFAQDTSAVDSSLTQPQRAIPDFGAISVVAKDHPDDNGDRMLVEWVDPGYENDAKFAGFKISRRNTVTGDTLTLSTAPFGSRDFVDEKAPTDSEYAYTVSALIGSTEVGRNESTPARSTVQWFNRSKTSVVVIAIIVCGAVIFFIETAKRGKKLFLRRIAGLEAIDEAVGRATEMGRPVLFVAGTQDMDDVQTLAGLTILGRVSKTIAQYDSKINMPCRASLVMTAGREIIKESYSIAGRPDAYSDDMVHYTTDEQFGFVAAVNGIMVREKPATCFYLGAFFAESLILAETGNSIDAIQIAGTAMPAQLPFFVAACDYTLIGEELFAASAYLSNEPKQLGSLKGQDVGKAIAMTAIIVGTVATTVGMAWNIEIFNQFVEVMRNMFSIGSL